MTNGVGAKAGDKMTINLDGPRGSAPAPAPSKGASDDGDMQVS